MSCDLNCLPCHSNDSRNLGVVIVKLIHFAVAVINLVVVLYLYIFF